MSLPISGATEEEKVFETQEGIKVHVAVLRSK